jgi:hypothetical protein
MSKTTSLGYTDTADAGSATRSYTRANLNWPVDFVPTEKSDMKFQAANKTSPIDQLETVRVQASEVSDVYKGTSIDPSVYAPSRKGLSIVAQVNDILRVTDSVDAAFQLDLPISAHLVIKVPQSSYITADQIMAVAGRPLAALFDSNQLTSGRIANLLRGAVTPTGL